MEDSVRRKFHLLGCRGTIADRGTITVKQRLVIPGIGGAGSGLGFAGQGAKLSIALQGDAPAIFQVPTHLTLSSRRIHTLLALMQNEGKEWMEGQMQQGTIAQRC